MRRDALLRGLALACVPCAVAQAQATPPPMALVRYDEDYSYLDGDVQRREWWEHVKRVPLGAGAQRHWSAGAELRAKYESYSNDEWSDLPDADHDYVWWRALPFVDLRGETLRAFAQLISAVEHGDEAGTAPVDEDRADLLQAFADLRLTACEWVVTLRGGRQVLAFGSERLISGRYGPNVLRAFDAAAAIAECGAWKVDALVGRPVASEPGEFDDSADDSRALWTLFGTLALGAQRGIDLYYIGYEAEEATFEQGTGREERHTFGSRIFGERAPWDWNFELFGQAGTFADGDIRAWSIASDTGYVLPGVALEPRVGLKANVISGDDDPDDGELGTFDPLFPKGKYFGEAGLVGPYNLVNVHPSLDFALSEQWTLGLASVLYWRESTDDGLYGNAGQLLRRDGASDERFIGSQFDVVVGFAPTRLLDVSLGYSAFVPGEFIETTGPDETVHFLGLELRFRF